MAIKLSPADEQRRHIRQASTKKELAAAIAQKQGVVEALELETEKDILNITYQNFYNGIISSYELEKRKINGEFITSVFVDQDVLDCANLEGRLYDINPSVFDPIRIPELDGGGLSGSPDLDNEERYNGDETVLLNLINNGISGGGSAGNIDSSITSASTSFLVDGTPPSISIGDRLIIYNGSACIVDVTNVDTTGVSPNEETIVDFTFYEPIEGVPFVPFATVFSGATINKSWAPFSDLERDSKTASDINKQDLMNNLVLSMQTVLNQHTSVCAVQKSAWEANEDEDKNPDVGTDLQSFIDDINTYLLTTDISDSGLSGLGTTLSDRVAVKNLRLSEIGTDRSVFFDKRYTFVGLRCNKARGSKTLMNNFEKGSQIADNAIIFAQTAATAFEV